MQLQGKATLHENMTMHNFSSFLFSFSFLWVEGGRVLGVEGYMLREWVPSILLGTKCALETSLLHIVIKRSCGRFSYISQ